MPVQTNYSLYTEKGFSGQLVDEELHNVTTKTAEEVLGYGVAVVRGANENGVKIVAASTDKFIGITLKSLVSQNGTSDLEQYDVGDSVNVLDFGKVYVKCESSVNAGDAVYMRFAAGPGGTVLGSLGNTADNDGTSDTAVLVPNATWESTATAGTIAVAKLR